MCLFPMENQQPVLAGQRFFEEKWQFHWTWNKNTHFTDENERNKFAQVSTFINNFSFRIILPFNNNNTSFGPWMANHWGWGGSRCFAHFPKSKKVRQYLRTRGRHCLHTRAHGRRLLMTRPWCLRRRRRRSPRTSPPKHDGRWWGCEWVPARQRYCWWLAAADGSQVGRTFWRLPWLIGSGPGWRCYDGASGLVLGSTVDTCSSVDVLWRCLFQFIVRVVDTALITETGTHSVKLCKVLDYPVMAQRTFPLVPCSRPQRFPSCSLLVRWSSWLCRSCSSGTRREETVEIPQLQPVFWNLSFARPLCATTVAWSMFWRSSSTVLTSLWPCSDVCSVEVPQVQFSPLKVDIPVVLQRRGLDFQHCCLWWRRRAFSTHFALFFALLRLSRSWAPVFRAFERSQLWVLEGSRGAGVAGSFTPKVTWHRGCQLILSVCWQKHSVWRFASTTTKTTTTIIQSGEAPL